jgi:N-acetylglutamate synthase-like GNAT family acetyltransferase
VVVREYGGRDFDACRALFDELLETHRALYPDGDVRGEFAPEGRMFVAEEEGRVVGYAGLLLHRRRAEVEPIVVAQDHRAQGVGHALVERVVCEAQEIGAAGIFVRPTARNRDAIAFFHSVGFDVLTYLRLEIDFEPRERYAAERIARLDFRV